MKKFGIILLTFVSFVLNSHGYSNDYDVRTKSNITAEQLNKKFDGNLKDTGKYFIEAQEEYGINAEFLAAIAIHESANGTSKAALKKNNFFGLMSKMGRQMNFSSPENCIKYAANNITKDNGYYYARGRYTIKRIGQRYANDKKWAYYVTLHMKSLKNEQ